MTEMLRGQSLACIRGDKPIFSDLDFELPPGRALILRGANGCGKSSLMKIIAGLLTADKGQLFWGNEDILGDKDWISRNICYLAHKNGMKPEMTVAENLSFWAGMEHHDYLSSGQARRAALTRVLCHPGRIWLLDEPTVGLDVAGVELLAGLMNTHLERGGRILAATHIELGLDAAKSTTLNVTDFAYKGSPVFDEELLC